MKRNSYVLSAILFVFAIASVNSCKKESGNPFKGNISATFNFVPDYKNGWIPPNPGPAWYPGSGAGQLTHIGNSKTVFNQYATLTTTGLNIVGASVNLFYKARLDSAGISVPDNVTNVYYDDHHNSIWAVSVSGTNNPVSPTRVEFTILHKIVGGTGRFEQATGAYTINGYFNPQTQQTFFSINGRIED